MKIKPVWWIGVAVWLVYNAIIYATWAAVGADYTDLAGRAVILERLILPEALGAIFMVAIVTWLGWWRPLLRETGRAGPCWTMWVLLPFLAGFMAVHLLLTDWSQIGPGHLALLALSCALIGFNEEALQAYRDALELYRKKRRRKKGPALAALVEELEAEIARLEAA